MQDKIVSLLRRYIGPSNIICLQEVRTLLAIMSSLLTREAPGGHAWAMDVDPRGIGGSIIIVGRSWRLEARGSMGNGSLIWANSGPT